MNPIVQTAELEMVAADRWASIAQKWTFNSFPLVDCGRCNGKGYDHFTGSQNAPGVCFRCAGIGRVVRAGKAQAEYKALCREIELNRLRFIWYSIKKALKALDAGGGKTTLDAYHYNRLEQRLEAYEQHADDVKKGLA